MAVTVVNDSVNSGIVSHTLRYEPTLIDKVAKQAAVDFIYIKSVYIVLCSVTQSDEASF